MEVRRIVAEMVKDRTAFVGDFPEVGQEHVVNRWAGHGLAQATPACPADVVYLSI